MTITIFPTFKVPDMTVVRSAWVRMSTALVVCLNSASVALWMASSLFVTSSIGESVFAMVVDEKFIWESKVRVGAKITVEKLSNSVHGYPSWFTSVTLQTEPQNKIYDIDAIPTGTRIIKFCPSAQEIPSTMAVRRLYGNFCCDSTHP